MKLRLLPLLPFAVLPLLAPGCSPSSSNERTWIPATLRTVESCEALEASLKIDALLRSSWAIDSQLAALQDDDGGFWGGMRGDDMMAAESSGPGQSVPPQSGPPDHSQTNIQVEGVDEADIVKTDGQYIYALHGSAFAILEAWPPSELELASATSIEGFPVEMFVTDGHAAVFSLLDGTSLFQALGLPPRPVPARQRYWEAPESGPSYYPVITKITTLTLDGTLATVEREWYVEGRYLSARLVNSHVRAVITGGPEGPALPTWTSYDSSGSVPDGLEAQRQANETAIHRTTLSDWVARRFVREGGVLRELSTCCTSYYLPTPGSTTAGYTQLYAFDLDRPEAELVETHVAGHARTVYSSLETMVIAGDAYSAASYVPSGTTAAVSTTGTHLHLFDVATDPSRPAYQASGSVEGTVHNQFSIDEHDGHLRVVTSDLLQGGAWGRSTNVFVLRQSGGSTSVVGEIRGIAPQEDVKAVRFVGERGYVVTFRQIDPLFVIDLADPALPAVLGELEIPGFSEYVHPIENGDYLLTIGQDGSAWGTSGNPALQLFDVRDPTNPTLVTKLPLPYGSSEAQYNHKAITFYHGMFTLPYTDWTDRWSSTLGLFTVDVEAKAIIQLGTVSHSSFYEGVGATEYTACSGWGYEGVSVRRGVFIDETLFAISPAGVTAHPIADLATTTASVELPPIGALDCSFTYGQDWDWGWR